MASRSIFIHGVSMTDIPSHLSLPKLNSSPYSPVSLFSRTSRSAAPLISPSESELKSRIGHILRASSDGVPSDQLEEDSKFVPLNDEDPSYGPPAILLLGFKVEEADQVQQLLKDLDGEFLQVVYCTEDMVTRSLWDAVSSKQQSLEKLKIAKSVPRLCFLSGLTGEEMMMFIDAYEETDLEPSVFAAHVPNSSHKSLQEVIDEVMGDHEMVTENMDTEEA